jgi:hypothetical protein
MGNLAVSEKTGERDMEGSDGCSEEQIYVTHKPKRQRANSHVSGIWGGGGVKGRVV